MKCFRCGYCCTRLLAVIVIDPELPEPFVEENLRGINQLRERCPHLRGDKVGEYSCAIHDKPWFGCTPCGQYQSHWPDRECRIGKYLVDKEETDGERGGETRT